MDIDDQIKAQKERWDEEDRLKDWTIPELHPVSRMCGLANHKPCTGVIPGLVRRACECACHEQAVAA